MSACIKVPVPDIEYQKASSRLMTSPIPSACGGALIRRVSWS